MSALNEVRLMCRCSSTDASRGIQSRSGDSQSGGSSMLDYYAHTKSFEDDVIECEEGSTAAERALRVTKRYLNSVFNALEIEFIKQILTTEDTPAQIAKRLNEDYMNLSKELNSKFAATSKYLIRSFYKCGYYCLDSLEFLPRLVAYVKHNLRNKCWIAENAEQRKASKHAWYLACCRGLRGEELRKANLEAKRAAKLATLSPEEQAKQLKVWEYSDRFAAKRKAAKAAAIGLV